MPEVQVRPALVNDISILTAINHSCQTDYVWQMDIQKEDGQVGAIFREIRLPRSVTVKYPRDASGLADSWSKRVGMLVAVIKNQVVGYIRMNDQTLSSTVWISDVVVSGRYRRQGVAMALILAAQSWAVNRGNLRALIEMPSKNHPMISLARKLGYEFCGYNDLYYESQDIALFFGRSLR
jgi:ribosomal protein S18 acetylase RimI-like enzyme